MRRLVGALIVCLAVAHSLPEVVAPSGVRDDDDDMDISPYEMAAKHDVGLQEMKMNEDYTEDNAVESGLAQRAALANSIDRMNSASSDDNDEQLQMDFNHPSKEYMAAFNAAPQPTGVTAASAQPVELPTENLVSEEASLMNGLEDGAGMGDMSHLHDIVLESLPRSSVFMNSFPAEDAIVSQMNAPVKRTHPLAPVSFLMADDPTDPASLVQTEAAPFYNQYAGQTGQPVPLPGVLAPPPAHPYGLPYFHRDPFMPLQTPYYHIPAFDSPQRNPALTPYYNPYVNPPPPIPPSVPAAPSFFPFHPHQHMIPPYFPYPPAPVIQPGPFPPYALPSHIQPGHRSPSAAFSNLPETRTDDPF